MLDADVIRNPILPAPPEIYHHPSRIIPITDSSQPATPKEKE